METIKTNLSIGEYIYENPNFSGVLQNNEGIFYYKEGLPHREGGLPAVEKKTGVKIWIVSGKRHNTFGPAFMNGSWLAYYINGDLYSEKEWKKKVRQIKIANILTAC